jgi:zinc transport system ATP-binding protein
VTTILISTPPAIEVDNVSFAYGATTVLERVGFAVAPGEFVALVGPNGSGKTTLLRVLLGLSPPAEGEARILGVPVARLRERWRVGYVPQRPAVASDLAATVEEVVAAGLLAKGRWARRLTKHDKEEIDHALESVALSDLRRAPLAELSGGQQQRAFIAKAFVTRPEIVILDEPVAGVDAEAQRRFRDSLVHLVEAHRSAVLLVSHELGAVADDLDRLLVLRHGRIIFDGTPAELRAGGVSLGIHREDLPMWLEELE